MLLISPVNPSDPASPSATPIDVSNNPFPKTIPKICTGCAPGAKFVPNPSVESICYQE
jgi:hypothetical protein